MDTKLIDFVNCISLREYLGAHGMKPSDEDCEDVGLEMLMQLLHQSYNPTTLYEVRHGYPVLVFHRDWMELFTPLLSQGRAVLQKVSGVMDRSDIDLRWHICKARRVTYEYWADEAASVDRDLMDKAIMRGIIKLARLEIGARNCRCAILDRETGQSDVQPEYPRWLLDSINWRLFG